MILQTERLTLRNWTEADFEPFCHMCADPEVMKYFPATLTRHESLSLALNIKSLIDARGWGAWAVEDRHQREFIGFVGLHIPQDNLPFSPCVELAWRLATPYWGSGYATEAAKAAINFGFGELALAEIVAFTAAINHPSRRVMDKIGMQYCGEDFVHPDIPSTHQLSLHVLYRMSRQNWLA